MIRFDPPADQTPLSPIECRAMVARSLYSYAGAMPTWAMVCTLADEGDVDCQAVQAAEMRRAKTLIDAYERGAAGIRHRNPLSQPEGARCVKAGLAIAADGLSPKGLRRAVKTAGVSEAMAKQALTAYGTAVHRIDHAV